MTRQTASDVVSDIAGAPAIITGRPFRQDRGRWGAYVNFLQQVTRGSGSNPRSGLSLFFNATLADRRTSVIDTQIAGGLTYTGPFQSRANDDIGLAIGATHVNSRVAWAQMLENHVGLGSVPVQRSEYVAEAYYTFRPRNGLEVRPNIQFVVEPGGTSQNRNALVFGLKTIANF